MKLGSLREGGRDGTLIVVDRGLQQAVRVPEIAPTLQHALETWTDCAPRLAAVYQALLRKERSDAFEIDSEALASPLPRALTA